MSLFEILPETVANNACVEALQNKVFGPGRFVKTAFRIREGIACDARFSFVAISEKKLVGSVRLTPVMIGNGKAYLLGPLCVLKDLQGKGIGKALVYKALIEVGTREQLPVILVGDAPYYKPLGFENAPSTIHLPGPVDYNRLLIAWPNAELNRDVYKGMMKVCI